jgi:hypothetical protein
MAMWYASLVGVVQSRLCQFEAFETVMPKRVMANIAWRILTHHMKPLERTGALLCMAIGFRWYCSYDGMGECLIENTARLESLLNAVRRRHALLDSPGGGAGNCMLGMQLYQQIDVAGGSSFAGQLCLHA